MSTEIQRNEATEIGLDELLAKMLSDETVHDVTLKGSDGVEVTAISKHSCQ